MARTERIPEGKDLTVPVSVPSASGKSELVVGKGSLRGGQLVVKFNSRGPAHAIQRLLERGSILGLQFVMVAPDDRNLDAQEVLEREEATSAELETIPEDDPTNAVEEPTDD